jgi:hypothetical protein
VLPKQPVLVASKLLEAVIAPKPLPRMISPELLALVVCILVDFDSGADMMQANAQLDCAHAPDPPMRMVLLQLRRSTLLERLE